MNPYRQYRNARMEFNSLRRYIRMCRTWADNRQNFKVMVESGWGDIVETEANKAKDRMSQLHELMLQVDPNGVFRAKFEKEMKRG